MTEEEGFLILKHFLNLQKQDIYFFFLGTTRLLFVFLFLFYYLMK